MLILFDKLHVRRITINLQNESILCSLEIVGALLKLLPPPETKPNSPTELLRYPIPAWLILFILILLENGRGFFKQNDWIELNFLTPGCNNQIDSMLDTRNA